jgi:hypothetical protein
MSYEGNKITATTVIHTCTSFALAVKISGLGPLNGRAIENRNISTNRQLLPDGKVQVFQNIIFNAKLLQASKTSYGR